MMKKTKMAGGGYMQVKKTGYSTGGMAEKQVSRAKGPEADEKGPKKPSEAPVKAAKGGMAKSKIKAKKPGFKPCAGCPSPAKCKAAGKCLKKSK
jgi:hypothetical protein